MTPAEFIKKWKGSERLEQEAAQEHFCDLCRLLGEKTPNEGDREDYGFEKGVTKTGGGDGWADVWRRGCFAWEYKSPGKNLDTALKQLKLYSSDLANPPLLIVSDTQRFRIHTNWTNMVQETHELTLDDLADARLRQKLKWAFSETDVAQLKPDRSRNETTEEVARDFVRIAQNLRDRRLQIAPQMDERAFAEKVAHFVNRMVFCMFAEDVDLLPKKLFEQMLRASLAAPEDFAKNAKTLFAAMAKRDGMVGFDRIDWFNGGLFDDDNALSLTHDDIKVALDAATKNWSEINPSIMGTLFERGLDPGKRSQLGAHYTDAEKIMLIVRPVIIEPLLQEWEVAKPEIADLLRRSKAHHHKATKTKLFDEAKNAHQRFIERLTSFRVLDPACGSGNFLFLALKALKDIEYRVNFESEGMGLTVGLPQVGPECVKGIEINPFAAELARVCVWVGEIQWMREHGFSPTRKPILKNLETIECRDALLNADGTEYDWPPADAIVGNPPFLGAKLMKRSLGVDETNKLRAVFAGRLPGFTDLVCYWFEKARADLLANKSKRAGLVATSSIRGGTNRPVMDRIHSDLEIFEAWSELPWVVEGARVEVSIVNFRPKAPLRSDIRLDGARVDNINPDLTTGTNLSSAKPLPENSDTAFLGIQKSGPLDVTGDVARAWLRLPTNPNGRTNADVLKPYWNGDDVTNRPRDMWLIDFPLDLAGSAASAFEASFEYLRTATYKPDRKKPAIPFAAYRQSTPAQNASWWEAHRPRPEMRQSITPLTRYLVTTETSQHRVWVWLRLPTLPDKNLIVVARDDDTAFGILQSHVHELWSLRLGTSLEDRPRYTSSTTFETFPFPDGLTPNIPAAEYANDPRAQAIAAAAARLNELRENWLNPPDLVRRVPEVVPGYPDRIVAVDERAAVELKTRTLTNLYNKRAKGEVAWLDNAHRDLDAAVAAAYGWGVDLTDDQILERLFALNQERAAAQ